MLPEIFKDKNMVRMQYAQSDVMKHWTLMVVHLHDAWMAVRIAFWHRKGTKNQDQKSLFPIRMVLYHFNRSLE